VQGGGGILLTSAGAVSASAYDQAKAAALAARAQLTTDEAQARVSRNDTGYTVLAADADRTVTQTLAEPGQVVAAGQTVVRLAGDASSRVGRRGGGLDL